MFGALCATGAAIFIGSSVAASSILAHYPPLAGQAVRYALAAMVMALLLRRRGRDIPRPTLRQSGRVLLLALTGLVGFNLCVLAALRTSDPATVGMIVGGTPAVLALVGPLLRRQAPRSRVLGAALVVTSGAAIVQGSGAISVPGLVLALCALAGESVFSLLAAPVLPQLGPLALSTYVCAAASALLAGGAVVADGPRVLVAFAPAQFMAIVYLALPVTVGGFLAWFSGLTRLGVERTGLFAGLIPISALLSTVVVGAGTVTLPRVIGAGLVGAGVAIGVTGRTRAE